MTKNTWLGLIFFIALALISFWKYWAWWLWKYLRIKDGERVFNYLASGGRKIEITGSSGCGKSWLLTHLFKQLNGVKFINCATPKSTFTLDKQDLQTHMVGKWSAPHQWYYFLDDIESFEEWSLNKFGSEGKKSLDKFLISQAPKLGAVSIWTNNGIKEHIFANYNSRWKVLGYVNFFDKSFLFVNINNNGLFSKWKFWPTIIPIDNAEIISYYDQHWNIPRHYEENFLVHIAQELDAHELIDIINAIKAGNLEKLSTLKESNNNIYSKLLEYIQLRKIEEKALKLKSLTLSERKAILKKKGISSKKITLEDLKEWKKNQQENSNFSNMKEARKAKQSKNQLVNNKFSTEDIESNEEE